LLRRIIIIILSIVFISACSSNIQSQIEKEPEPLQKEKTLQEIFDEMAFYEQEIGKRHSIKILQTVTGFGQNAIILEVRRFGDFEKLLTEDEINSIKESFYDYAGQEYNLKVIELECCNQEANFVGEITEIDNQNKRVQIFNDEYSDEEPHSSKDKPKVNWLQLDEDGKILLAKNQENKDFSDLSVGQKVRAWSLKYIGVHPLKAVVKIEILSE
jgi:hypothetical protein